jgi:hypothetical protein
LYLLLALSWQLHKWIGVSKLLTLIGNRGSPPKAAIIEVLILVL